MTDHSVARRAALLVGAALLGVYFALAAFSQAPLSPAKIRYGDQANTVLSPYFTQDWLLFAPEPLADDRGILARASCPDGTRTPFYDVTNPYVERTQKDRFFPSRMSRLVSGGMQSMENTDPFLNRVRQQEAERDKPVLPPLPFEERSRESAVRFLARYSLTQMPGACDGKPEKVQVRLYVHEFRPWSKRNDPEAKEPVHAEDLSWLKVGDLR
ncbi:DUF5819 family protein [Streptomyces sp. NPDC019507]|uniref:DUF5819 family protein n=1 Tax=Streptomyces sp. NPDC019507 TaxID=3154689 RepID=UPI0033D207DD